MYKLEFKDRAEVRMGSPFKIAKVYLKGGQFLPDLSSYFFQDLGCVNKVGDSVLLVEWITEKNEPGFKVWYIREVDSSITRSRRISGCCKAIRFVNDAVAEVTYWNFQDGDKALQITLTCKSLDFNL